MHIRRSIFLTLFVCLVALPGLAQTLGPAPAGEPTVVAQQVIHYNFGEQACPLVTGAARLGDGSIKAVCNNGESFRVFNVAEVGDVAMRCAAAEAHGIPGC